VVLAQHLLCGRPHHPASGIDRTLRDPEPQSAHGRDPAKPRTIRLCAQGGDAIRVFAGFAAKPERVIALVRSLPNTHSPPFQLVTGLTVNAKVNVRPEYYRFARAMCDSLFETGAYYRPTLKDEAISSMGPLAGILAHIHHVKDTIDHQKELEKKNSYGGA